MPFQSVCVHLAQIKPTLSAGVHTLKWVYQSSPAFPDSQAVIQNILLSGALDEDGGLIFLRFFMSFLMPQISLASASTVRLARTDRDPASADAL
jgi:hypothetical protein